MGAAYAKLHRTWQFWHAGDVAGTTDKEIHKAATALRSVFMTEQWMCSHVYKVGDPDRFRMFAILNPGRSQLTLKLADPDRAELLIEAGVGQPNAHLPRGGWITLLTDRLEPDDVADRLSVSHGMAAKGLPRVARLKFGLD
ncbi:MAG: MmcQ/YjbR family DNA-binding protein [Pseudomonadota bacterium]